jgi:putative membrane protein
MGWWWVFGGMWMLVFWAIMIGLVVWGVKQFTVGGKASRTSGDTPLEIAQKRLARGEITREEFDQIKIGLGVNGLEAAGAFQLASRQ